MNQQKDDFREFLTEIRQSFQYRVDDLAGTFADELWCAMSSKALSQAELARKAELSRQFLNHVFRGKPNLTLRTMQKLADSVGHKLHIHLAPADMHCEWLHFLTDQPQKQLNLAFKAEVLPFKKIEEPETADDEDLAIAA
jgi:transcriptional regulator with XRE-family HTH domain